MQIKYFDKDKKELDRWSRYENAVFFKFELITCSIVIERDDDTYALRDDEYGELLKESEIMEIKKGMVSSFHFGNTDWAYDHNTAQIYIHNHPIEI